MLSIAVTSFFFFFQAEDGIRDVAVTGVQTCALPILPAPVTQHRELFARSADQLVNASALAAVAPGAQPQVHLDAEIRKDARALRQIDDAVPPHLVRPDGPQRLPVQTDLSVPRRQKAEEHLQ